jgi:tetratricopeptide (TPR) repeat protein
VLAQHPLGTDIQVASHYDLLAHLGARGRASRVLDEGLRRFPESATLHDCLRQRTLRERGPNGLVEVYEAWLAEPEASAQLRWFAGYAGIVAAEFHRRRNRSEEAAPCYARALALFDETAESLPESRDSADHFAALILGAEARLALEAGDLEGCLASLRASFARRPMSAASLDGLNLSPMDTARMLRGRLVAEERGELTESLDAETEKLRAIDPSLLQLPAYERGAAGQGPRRRNR